MNNLQALTNLKLVWIENNGYWVYCCSTCHQTKLEKQGGSRE